MAETFEAYRTRVLSYLGDEEPIGVQQATPSQLDRRLRDVVPEELIRRPAPEKWSIAEIVAHLADAELAMGWRLRNMLANPGVALTWWDQAVWAERLGYAQQDASLSAGVFRALRESNLRLLESVPWARWVECYGVHEVRGRQTVEEFVRLEAAHDLNHLRQIDRILGLLDEPYVVPGITRLVGQVHPGTDVLTLAAHGRRGPAPHQPFPIRFFRAPAAELVIHDHHSFVADPSTTTYHSPIIGIVFFRLHESRMRSLLRWRCDHHQLAESPAHIPCLDA